MDETTATTEPRLCNQHGGPEDAEQHYTDCDECERLADLAEAEEDAREEARIARDEKIEVAWRARGGVCADRPFRHRMSSLDRECKNVLEFLDQLCDCQVCEDCGSPHNTGREEFAEDECQCLAGRDPWH